eukprot:TRINITY_DN6619_c0_g1_i1.p1 TRINITY_DN6619_c0_g1~~TRINITY_DN6619_c0_g1_i1.p1  ORF type:complete len:142 (+),score=19.82 TRINITY_DN6619_c0_g1_i1:218-643(+)
MNDTTLSYEILQQINNNVKIVWQANSLPWPLWSRDAVMISIKHIDYNNTNNDAHNNVSYMITSTSVGIDGASLHPCDKKRYERSVVHINTFYFESLQGGKCRLTRLVNVDPVGSIPPTVVNTQARRIYMQPKWLNDNIFNH